MRIAIISDIHSNIAALERVFSYIDSINIDEIYCLGDLVGYGPFPDQCIDLIKSKSCTVIAGNHDYGAIGKIPLRNFSQVGRTALRWTKKNICKENQEFLSDLPLKVVRNDITFVHASPFEPENWTYIFSNLEAKEAFKGFSTSICFIGHTHIPSIVGEDLSLGRLHRNGRFIVNVGSVGQPRDGNPKLSFGILDTDKLSYELIRLDYDVQKTIDAIEQFSLPSVLGRRLIYGI